MTKVTIYNNELDEIVGFKAYGHAEYDDSGYDIVCAAISILTINTINAIDAYADDRTSLVTDEDAGCMEYKILGRPTAEATLLLNTMVLGLESMVENYENYIDLKFEEV